MPQAIAMPPSPHAPLVAIVLPPKERFGPSEAGAISLLVHRLATAPGSYRRAVFGMPVAAPFNGTDFRPVAPAWRPANLAMRYGIALARDFAQFRPALIEVHNRPDIALLLARRLPTTPVVLVLHNDPQGMRQGRTATQRARLLARLARVVTVSAFLRDRLLDGVAGPARPPVVVPNCIDPDTLPSGPPIRDATILFVGRVAADKGADTFVAACAEALPALPGWRGEIIGADRFGVDSRDTPFLRRLRLRAAAAGVALTGYRPHADVLAAMGRAAIVAAPSRWAEPFGMTALEAMACGAALVCSTRGGLAEVVGDAAVPIDPDDPGAIAAALIALARDPARRAALGTAGRTRAGLFNVVGVAATLDALRRDVLRTWSMASFGPI